MTFAPLARRSPHKICAAVLSFFGFIHGTSLGIGSLIPVTLGNVIFAGVCFVLGRQSYAEAVVPAGHAAVDD